jgi:transcriptional regulator with AAA-type ATPase domain/tetratricopeptide (TPR) repeat protein/ABC-type lipoprotein export system ATPase subunit
MDELSEVMGTSRAIGSLRAEIRRLVGSRPAHRLPSILIQGETGTGKGLVAKLLHRLGARRDGAFVDVNCAAIPETLLESEFFGYERGAFTDARRSKPGLFQTAHRGTIFLDEIGLLPEVLQAKLLKVIEERSVRRLGATQSEHVDVWIISATNTDLSAAIATRKFRADLYHRLAVVPLVLPPLREREDDALLLAEHFLARASADYGLPAKTLTADARARVLTYSWPGNVRELANTMERAALLSETPEVSAAVLELRDVPPSAPAETGRPARSTPLNDAIHEHLQTVLNETNGNISRTAAVLGISRNTLRAHIRKFGLRVPDVARGGRPAPAPGASVGDAGRTVVLESPTPTSPPGTLRWERRMIAALATSLDAAPDVAAYQLASTQQEILSKLRSFGARVEELTPVGMVALFGLDPIEDAASRAAHAALGMLRTLEREQSEQAPPVQARFAIHASRCVIAHGIDVAGMDAADRMEVRTSLDQLIQAAEPNTIVADDGAAEFLRRRFELQPTGVAGASAARKYRVIGPGGTGFEWGGRELSPFVGRDQDLTPLQSLLERAEAGRGQVVGIVGEPGVGKSRLLHELRQSLSAGRVTYLEGRCVSHGNTLPYVPIIDFVRSMFGIVEADSLEMTVTKVRSGLQMLTMEPKEWVPYLLHLLGHREMVENLASLSPEAVKARTMEALRLISLRRSRQRPIIVAIEDLHWIDQASEHALSSLAETFSLCPILLLATYRPGYEPPWLGRAYASELALQRLSDADSLAVVRSVVPEHRLATEIEQRIVSHAEGIPFFLEELARAVVEHPDLRSEVSVPETIQDVLMARLDRLPAEERELLQTASVLGKDVSVPILCAVTGVAEPAVRWQLGRLQAAEFLYEKSLPSAAPEFTFKHALTHEVAYRSVLEARRRALHARVVEAIEALYPERLSEYLDRLAYHVVRGGVWAKAVPYLRRAGERALMSSANREAAEFFRQALSALGQLPQTPATLEQAIDVRMNLRDALWVLAKLSDIDGHLRAAEALAVTLGDRRREGWIACYMCQYFWAVVALDAALGAGERALAISQSLPAPALQAETSFYLGLVHLARGDARQAAEIFSSNLKTLDDVVQAHRSEFLSPRFAANGPILMRGWMARVLAELGNFADAEAWGQEAVRLAEAGKSPFALIAALAGLGASYVRQGQARRAIPPLQHGLELCRGYNFNNWLPTVAACLGNAYASLGEIDSGIALLETAVEEGARGGITSSYSLWLVYLGEACLLAHRTQDALVHAQRALTLSSEHKELGYEAWALRLFAEIAASADPPDGEAETKYQNALALAERLGMRPLVARCHLGLGRLYERVGDRARAETHLARGAGLCRELAMPLTQGPETA